MREMADLTQHLEDATRRRREQNRATRAGAGPSDDSASQEREQAPENPAGVGPSGDSAVKQNFNRMLAKVMPKPLQRRLEARNSATRSGAGPSGDSAVEQEEQSPP